MKNKITFLLIGLLVSASLPIAGKTKNIGLKTSLSETEKFLRWNVLEFGISMGTIEYFESNTIGKGCGLGMKVLSADIFFPKYKIGIGTALAEVAMLPSDNMDTPDRCVAAAFPLTIYGTLYHNEWGLGRCKFVNTINCFGEVLSIPTKIIWPDAPITLGCGVEWTPGLLLNLKAGYRRILGSHFHYPDGSPTPDESSLYASLNLFLGAVNPITKGAK
ncbi:MAG: hypothetical protein WC614_08940 [bacterium]